MYVLIYFIAGLSPLMLAAFEGHKKIACIIVEFGGDTNKRDICGRSALDLATECCKDEIRDYLETVTLSKLKTGMHHLLHN